MGNRKLLQSPLIEGQEMMDEEGKGQTESISENLEDEFYDELKKQGLLQRIWVAITNK